MRCSGHLYERPMVRAYKSGYDTAGNLAPAQGVRDSARGGTAKLPRQGKTQTALAAAPCAGKHVGARRHKLARRRDDRAFLNLNQNSCFPRQYLFGLFSSAPPVRLSLTPPAEAAVRHYQVCRTPIFRPAPTMPGNSADLERTCSASSATIAPQYARSNVLRNVLSIAHLASFTR